MIEREIQAPWIPAGTLVPEDEVLTVVMLEKPRRAAYGMRIKGEWRVKWGSTFAKGSETVIAWKKMPTPTKGWTLSTVLTAVMKSGLRLPEEMQPAEEKP